MYMYTHKTSAYQIRFEKYGNENNIEKFVARLDILSCKNCMLLTGNIFYFFCLNFIFFICDPFSTYDLFNYKVHVDNYGVHANELKVWKYTKKKGKSCLQLMNLLKNRK